MEPLKPAERTELVDFGANPGEVLEYESLLAARFNEDPNFGLPPVFDPNDPQRLRLEELVAKLYPNGIRQV